jgi:hypothetical protein
LQGRLARKPEDYLPGSESGGALPQQWQRVPFRARDIYANWVEVVDWSPGEWAQLEPSTSRWWSATASRPQLDDNLKSLVERCRKEGVQVAARVDTVAAGPAAAVLAEEHPTWFHAPVTGQVSAAGADMKNALSLWNDPAWRKTNPLHPGTFARQPDFSNREILDYGLEQAIRSVRHYGWDLLVFDGWFSIPGDDNHSAQNVHTVRERLAAAYPRLAVGFSKGGTEGEWRAALAKDGLCMLSDIIGPASTNRPPARWDNFARTEAERVGRIQANGGHYYRDWKLDYAPAPEAYYTLVYGLIAGGHPFPFDRDILPGCPRWGAFMARWSAMLWDPALKPVADPRKRFEVSDPRLEWEPHVRMRRVDAHRAVVVLHLVNPSGSPVITQTWFDRAPGPSQVSFTPEKGTKLERVTLVQPEASPFSRALTIERGGRVQVPRIGHWAMLLWEISGNFEESQH